MNYGRYQIVKEVGKGSMGVVYQARDPHIERLVAVKVLREDRVTSDDFVKRFLKEARVIGRLTHSHIVAIYDVGEEQGTVYIAMEFLEGVSLSDVIKRKRLETRDVVGLGIQLAETLDYAHQKGVVHRDIKPSNIIVQDDGQIKITDFGIAHVEDATATLQTQAGEIMGTPAYMSPEQALSKPVDGRTDIFSLGIILYELSTGRRPFGGEGKNLMTVLNEIVETTPQEPLVLMPSVPKELSRIIMKAMQKEPGKRFQTGKEMAEALRRCLEEAAPGSVKEAPPVKPKRRVMYSVAIGVTIVVVIGACGVYFFTSRRQDTRSPVPVTRQALPPEPAATSKPQSEVVPGPAVTAPSQKIDHPLVTSPPLEIPKPSGPDNSAEVKPPINKKPPEPEPVEKVVSLNIVTAPPGAKVYINGAPKGTTPVVLTLKTGQYKVRLSRPGYQDSERQIKLKKDVDLAEDLKPLE